MSSHVLRIGIPVGLPHYVSVLIIDREGALRKAVLSHLLVRGVYQLRYGPTPHCISPLAHGRPTHLGHGHLTNMTGYRLCVYLACLLRSVR
jgi:hypothetical protein